MFIGKCSIQLIPDILGITYNSQNVSAIRPESNVHSARTSNDANVIWNMCMLEELNKFKFCVHATGGKHFKFEDHPSFVLTATESSVS